MPRIDSEEARRWFLTVCAVIVLVLVVLRSDGAVNPYIVVLLGGMMGLGILKFGGSTLDGNDRNDQTPRLPRKNESEGQRMVERDDDPPEVSSRIRRRRRSGGMRFLVVGPAGV